MKLVKIDSKHDHGRINFEKPHNSTNINIVTLFLNFIVADVENLSSIETTSADNTRELIWKLYIYTTNSEEKF